MDTGQVIGGVAVTLTLTLAFGLPTLSDFMDNKYQITSRLHDAVLKKLSADPRETEAEVKALVMCHNFQNSIFYSRKRQSPAEHRLVRDELYKVRRENYPWWGQILRWC